MVNPTWRAGAGTDTGRHREHNEDAFLCLPEEGIFAVIDGVGGYAGGEVAAAEAREVIHRRLQHRTGTPEDRLREAVTNANNKIYWHSREEPDLFGMACVLTAALLHDGRLFAAHVGDTRLYKIRNHHIQKITRDHSFVGMREDRQELSEYEAMHHPRRNEILRDVGSELHEPNDDHFIDIVEASFEPDAALLLCTDGLTDLVPARELLRVVHAYAGAPEAAAEALIEAANAAGGTDNITVVVVEGPRFGEIASPASWAEAAPIAPNDTAPEPAPSRPRSGSAPPAEHAASSPPSPWKPYFLGVLTTGVLLAAAYAAWSLWPSGSVTPSPTAPVPSAILPDSLPGVINGMLARARPGDTVSIPPGIYRETVRLRDGIILRSAQPGAARLVPPPDSLASDTVAVRAEGIVGAAIVGFHIGPDTTAGAIDSFAVGIMASRAGLRIDSVTVTGTTYAGVAVDLGAEASEATTLRHSMIVFNAGMGVAVRGTPTGLRLLDNTIRSNQGVGVVFSHDAGIDLRGNTILDNGGVGIEIRLDTTLARIRAANTLTQDAPGRQVQDVRVVLPSNHLPD